MSYSPSSIITIYDTPNYLVDSYGNGAAYVFTSKVTGRDIYLAGDDAEIFRADLDGYTECQPQLEFDIILGRLWDMWCVAPYG
jgi:hypothetical protein